MGYIYLFIFNGILSVHIKLVVPELMKAIFKGLKGLSLQTGEGTACDFKFDFQVDSTSNGTCTNDAKKSKKKKKKAHTADIAGDISDGCQKVIIQDSQHQIIEEVNRTKESEGGIIQINNDSSSVSELPVGNADEETECQPSQSKKKKSKKKNKNKGRNLAAADPSVSDSKPNVLNSSSSTPFVVEDNSSTIKPLSSSLPNAPPGLNRIYPKTGIHFMSPKDPELDPKLKLLAKYGQGKNLVAIGPKKVKDPSWLRDDYGNQIAASTAEVVLDDSTDVTFHHSPFTFSFGGL